jgi:6-phospho-3-hexuloisomerase
MMESIGVVQREIAATLGKIDATGFAALREAFGHRDRRWFVSGQGRSRLVAGMAAMRLMHLGVDVHLTGEVTAPSIGDGDWLLMLSASGETPVSLHVARRAADAGAGLLAITTRDDSTLAAMADIVVAVPASGSAQFGGSLFEQSALILLDALVIDLTRDDPDAHRLMRLRHTNLE